jgi:hypothetical protein
MIRELHPRVRQLIDRLVDSPNGRPSEAPDELVELTNQMDGHQRSLHYFYWDLRINRCSARLAEMLALQSPPMSSSDREFLEGKVDNGHLFGGGPLAEDMGERYKKVAEAGGQNVKGKVYIGGLARVPGDPEAWVSDRGDVKRVIEARGWKCQGAVEVNPSGQADELAAMYREAKPHMGPGLDMDEDGYVEVATGPQGEVIEAKLDSPELVERR